MQYLATNVKKKSTGYNPGICKIILVGTKVLPRIKTNNEGVFVWPAGLPLNAMPLYTLVELDLLKDTFKIAETPKDSKAGSFYDIKMIAESNNADEESLRSLTTLTYTPVQAIVFLNNGKKKIYGQSDRGLDLSVSHELGNDGVKIEKLTITITGQSKELAPFTDVTL